MHEVPRYRRFASLLLALWSLALTFSYVVGQETVQDKGTKKISPTQSSPEQEGWLPLIPAQGLEGWEITDFYGHGEVKRQEELLVFEPGKPLTGITYAKKDFPSSNFEIELEARRVSGNDFFCGLTFPVGKGFCSYIAGGWGGSLVGISSVNGADASENSNSSSFDFKNGQWYKFRIRVDDEFVRGWIDKKEMFAQEREGNQFSTRIEVNASQPLGMCVFQSKVEMKNFRWRAIDPETGKPIVK
jgi:Domain of Unknown Function (DUF1080)